jgi:hypothetical protein
METLACTPKKKIKSTNIKTGTYSKCKSEMTKQARGNKRQNKVWGQIKRRSAMNEEGKSNQRPNPTTQVYVH